MIVWIMGLNGAGKSSVANELKNAFCMRGIPAMVLDGNHLREIFEQNGYDRASRIALGIRYAQLAKTLSEQSHKAIIIAANGMLKEVCEYNRLHLQEYYEIFLDVPLDVLKKRDSAGIYTRFASGLVKNVGGLDLEVDIPKAHLHIPYDESLSPLDIAKNIESFIFSHKAPSTKPKPKDSFLGTKAQTLVNLAPRLHYGKILPLWTLSKKDFSKKACLQELLQKMQESTYTHFIVRSSSKNEDNTQTSNAGAFESVPNVSLKDMQQAIERVFCSYAKIQKGIYKNANEAFEVVDEDEIVLIQPMLSDIVCAGVAFNTHPKTNAPYYVLEYSSTSTSEITEGSGATQTFYIAHSAQNFANAYVQQIVLLLKELERLIPHTPLDCEFGITKDAIYCFQVRPLVLHSSKIYPSALAQLTLLKNKIFEILKPHPSLYGDRGILGIMPDWNPAEIIGLHPRPLAFSLYAKLITDSVYATQRAAYGYKDVSSNPLIYNLHGKPYVDVRASFNSFLPKNLDAHLSKLLVNYYLQILRENPQWHDKVEFEILFDSYYFDTQKRLKKLHQYGFSHAQTDTILCELKTLTNHILEHKIYTQDIALLSVLAEKRERILGFDAPLLEKIYWLLQDCKNYGTKPFVGLARVGFMAMGFLNALVKEGILDKKQKDSFIQSLQCITSTLTHDLAHLSQADFLRKYGHLRPGTYDILSPRYDEQFAFYFKQKSPIESTKDTFALSLSQMRNIDALLKEHQLACDVLGFFDFIATGIIYREQSKFEFTKNLSDALSMISILGREYGLSAEDMSYCDVDIFFKAYGTSNNLERLILESIEYGKGSYMLQQAIVLPPLITSSEEVECFCITESMPNFITQKRVCAPVVWLTSSIDASLEGKIVCISRADPGFDWIFSHQIAGLITEFGGANSHMAIRANELSIPAVIGCGEKFSTFAQSAMLEIDCANSKVAVI